MPYKDLATRRAAYVDPIRRERVRLRQERYNRSERGKAMHRAYAIANRDRIREYQQGLVAAIKADVVGHYGGKCACCGETNIKFLTVDHINGDGGTQRKALRKNGRNQGGGGDYRQVIKNNYPADLQILCYNCNCGRDKNGGICPHKEVADG